MFNALRSKLVALAALAASFMLPDDNNPTPHGPERRTLDLPMLRPIQQRRSRKGKPTLKLVAQRPWFHNPAGTKLLKRFAEAGSRGPRGY